MDEKLHDLIHLLANLEIAVKKVMDYMDEWVKDEEANKVSRVRKDIQGKDNEDTKM